MFGRDFISKNSQSAITYVFCFEVVSVFFDKITVPQEVFSNFFFGIQM